MAARRSSSVLWECQLVVEGVIHFLEVDLLAGQVLVTWSALGAGLGRTAGGVSGVVADGYELPGHAVRRDR